MYQYKEVYSFSSSVTVIKKCVWLLQYIFFLDVEITSLLLMITEFCLIFNQIGFFLSESRFYLLFSVWEHCITVYLQVVAFWAVTANVSEEFAASIFSVSVWSWIWRQASTYKTAWSHNPEDHNPNKQDNESLKSYILYLCSDLDCVKAERGPGASRLSHAIVPVSVVLVMFQWELQ